MCRNLNEQFLNAFITLTQNFSLFYYTYLKKIIFKVTFVCTHKSVFSMIEVKRLHRLDWKFSDSTNNDKELLCFSKINFHYLVFIKKNSINSANVTLRYSTVRRRQRCITRIRPIDIRRYDVSGKWCGPEYFTFFGGINFFKNFLNPFRLIFRERKRNEIIFILKKVSVHFFFPYVLFKSRPNERSTPSRVASQLSWQIFLVRWIRRFHILSWHVLP